MYSRSVLIGLLFLAPALAAGSSLSATLGADGGKPRLAAVSEVQVARATSDQHDDEPIRGLSADLVYSILVGEVASQRGDLGTAFTHYLEAARLSAEAPMAELATQSALAANDLQAAQRGVALWLELDPEAVVPRLAAAHVALRLGKRQHAALHLQKVVELSGSDEAEGLLEIAAVIATISPVDQRLELMRALVAVAPGDADAHYALAMVAADADDYEAAAAAAREALRLRPEWDKPRLILVRILLAQNKRVEAREVLEDFVDATPENHVLRMLYAQLLVEDREFSNARNVFERMLHSTPKEPDVLFAIGILSLQLEDTAAARDYFERLYATGQRRDDAALYLGQIAEIDGELDEALAWYEKVSGEGELDAQVRSARARAAMGEIDKAQEVLQRLRDQFPEHAVTMWLIEAETLREHGRSDMIMATYNEALSAHPGNAELLYARALYAVSLGQVEVLEQDLRAILAANPDHADALNALGYTLADRTDRLQEAYGYIERALALKPEEPAVLDSMGWVLFRLGRHDEALSYLRKAYERMPDGEIAAHLGEVLWVAGQRDEAWRIWDEALAADPDHEYLQSVIGRYRYSRKDGE